MRNTSKWKIRSEQESADKNQEKDAPSDFSEAKFCNIYDSMNLRLLFIILIFINFKMNR